MTKQNLLIMRLTQKTYTGLFLNFRFLKHEVVTAITIRKLGLTNDYLLDRGKPERTWEKI